MIEVQWQPKQEIIWDKVQSDVYNEARKTCHTVIGIGGARGGCKSHTIRNVLYLRSLVFPKTNGLIFRRTRGDLEQNHIWPLLEEHPELAACYNDQKKVIKLDNGSRIIFGYGENDKDVDGFLGQQYDTMGIDQAESISEYSIKMLLSCNRRSSSTSPVKVPKCLISFNPGGISHGYMKRIFIDKIYREKERAENYFFIKAFLWDNFFWAAEAGLKNVTMETYHNKWTEAKRKEFCLEYAPYVEKINEQPEHIRRAWIEGDFDTFMGQFFGMFSREIHCIDSSTLQWKTVPEDFPIVAGLDYGNTTVLEPIYRDFDGKIFCDFELRMDDASMSAEEKANYVAGHIKHTIGRPGMPVIGDVNMGWIPTVQRRTHETPYEIFRRAGINLRLVSKTRDVDGKRPRVMFNRLVKDALAFKKNSEGVLIVPPKLYFVEDRTPSIVRNLPQLMTDKNDPEDFETPSNVEDHDTDALKYAMANIGKAFRDQPQEEVEEDESYRFVPMKYTTNSTSTFDIASF